MGEVTVHASQRELAIGVLLELAQDEKNSVEERSNAACSVIDATNPLYHPQGDNEEALRLVSDQIADRVIARIEIVEETAHA